MLRHGIIVASILLSTLALAPASSQVQYAYPVTQWTELTDGMYLSTGTYNFDGVRIAPGSRVFFTGDTTLRATYVIIDGTLQGVTPSTAGAKGPSIVVEAQVGLEVRGAVNGGRGANGAPAFTGNRTVAMPGGNGGSVTLDLFAPTPLLISSTAYIRSGSGGDGGHAIANPGNTSGPEATATGGAGGSAGSIQLKGSSLTLDGILSLGNGGRGGDARAEFGNARTNAVGGRGGDVGWVALPSGFDARALANAGRIIGANGGHGGHGWANSNPAPGVKPCLIECQNNGQSDWAAVQDYGEWGANATLPRQAGGDGGPGAPARARGGDGGGNCAGFQAPPYVCVSRSGGMGGNAWAIGGPGGHGGSGGPGALDGGSLVGGPGGRGGDGGIAEANAGRGGCPTLNPDRCADPGASTAQTTGGSGGAAGAGAWTDAVNEIILQDCTATGGNDCFEGVDPAILCGVAGPAGDAGVTPLPVATSPSRADLEQETWTEGSPGSEASYDSSFCVPPA
ncbi:MAG TPA: hypothetical protein VNX21_04055 [Candidatus Thermoplasmatota archaeon]|nr:hypothetical protein [Candidatus Thermoplasmatota archaeon]